MRRFLVSLLLLAASALAEEETCKLYMAQSSIFTASKPKFALFAGVDFHEGDVLPLQEIAIPLADFFENPNKVRGHYESEIINYFENFVWNPQYFGARWEGNFSATMFVPGNGLLTNYHSCYANVKWDQAATINRGRQLIAHPGKPHPARGAITPYHNLTIVATKWIPAGTELFMDFGDTWDRKMDNDAYQDKITRWDYEDADEVVKAIVKFMDKHGGNMDLDLQEGVLDFILENVLGTATEKRAKIIRGLIPANPRKLQKVLDVGGTFLYRYKDVQRDMDWLESAAQCVDKVRPGISSIPYAGRGAFASRDIKDKEMIMAAPMVPMASDGLMDMYEMYEAKDEHGRSQGYHYNYEKPLGRQILNNYVFSHPESSMNLVPYGPHVMYVNHGSLNTSANAYITWSKDDEIYNDNALHDFTTVEAMNQEYPIITMGIFAIRDIKEGEEILIDYGSEWEKAWAEYMKLYEASDAVKENTWPLKAEDMREVFRNQSYPTGNPYPDGVKLACMVQVGDPVDGMPHETEEGYDILPWVGPKEYKDMEGQYQALCEITSVDDDDDGETTYTAKTRITGYGDWVIVTGIPHYCIIPVDAPYQGDIFSPGAFRHYISIEDRLFPQKWRDLRQ